MYDIKTLCQNANISQQTFYRLVRENEEFRILVESKREKRGNGYKYDRAVLEWLCAFYDRVSSESQTKPATESTPEDTDSPSDCSDFQEQINSLIEENNALESEIEALKTKLETTEHERKMLFAQNAQLIMLLGQEKQEKQAMLPSPRKPLFERIKAFIIGDKKSPPTTL